MPDESNTHVCPMHHQLEDYMHTSREMILQKFTQLDEKQTTMLTLLEPFKDVKEEIAVLKETAVKSNGFVTLKTEFQALKKAVSIFAVIVISEIVGLFGIGLVYIIRKVIASDS